MLLNKDIKQNSVKNMESDSFSFWFLGSRKRTKFSFKPTSNHKNDFKNKFFKNSIIWYRINIYACSIYFPSQNSKKKKKNEKREHCEKTKISFADIYLDINKNIW